MRSILVILPRGLPRWLSRWLLLGLSIGIELEVALALLRGAGGLLHGLCTLALHLGAAGLCAAGLKDRLPPPITLGICALLPPLGPLCAALLALPLRALREGAGESWKELRRQASDAAAERRRGEQRVGVEIEPIVDALRDEDPEVRIAAIDALQREMSPRAAHLLQEAQRDPVFEVKLRATEALAALAKAAPGGALKQERLLELELLLQRRDYAGLAAACARLRTSGEPIEPEAAEAIYFWAGWKGTRARP